MRLTREFIESLRKKSTVGPFIFLIDFYDQYKNIIFSLTNDYADFEYNRSLYVPPSEDVNNETTTYKEFPFIVSIPEFSEGVGSSIQLTFINTNFNGIDNLKNDLPKTVRVVFNFINKNLPQETFFEQSTYFYGKEDTMTVDKNYIAITFSKQKIYNAKFPFRVYNRVDHPSLYVNKEDYDILI